MKRSAPNVAKQHFIVEDNFISDSDFIAEGYLMFRQERFIEKSTCSRKCFFLVTPTGIEPMIAPWEGAVLTAWPRGLNQTTNI